MVAIKFLKPDEPMPDDGEDATWLLIEPFDNDGKYYGTGAARTPTGGWVGYASLAENDVSLERALEAARAWAKKYDVSVICVRTEPETER